MVSFDVTKAPGVYVFEEKSSAPIAGVGTSTAGFIGIISSEKVVANSENKRITSSGAAIIGEKLAQDITVQITDKNIPQGALSELNAKIIKAGKVESIKVEAEVNITVSTTNGELNAWINQAVKVNEDLTLDNNGKPQEVKRGNPIPDDFKDKLKEALGDKREIKMQQVLKVAEQEETSLVDKLLVDPVTVKTASITYKKDTVIDDDLANLLVKFPPIKGESINFKEAKLCTNFSEFKKHFGDFSDLLEHNRFVHAVSGFFKNGGTRCFVIVINSNGEIKDALEKFEAIDEIAIVAAPGITDSTILSEIDIHCRQTTQDRVAIFDGPEKLDKLEGFEPNKEVSVADKKLTLPAKSDYAALYYPWIQVYDSASNKNINVPPSGHIAGIYARVDSQRGVFKAPANEPIFGALGVAHKISKRHQDGLNSQGVNCIRELNGSILVWGARTWGGKDNGDFQYISTRRLFNYIRESIDEGTQWVVFEPNSPDLWARIRREVTAFLTTVWRSGALFGNTPEEAFFVKCDAETNPPEERRLGKVVAQIGVSVVTPAEFVIFSLSQQTGNGGS